MAATFLPATDFSTRQPYPEGRRVVDAGATIALASTANPGSSHTTSMAFCIVLAVRDLHLTIDEAVAAATVGRAAALPRTDVGRLTPGSPGHAGVLDAPSHHHLAYRPGVPLVRQVGGASSTPDRTHPRGAPVTNIGYTGDGQNQWYPFMDRSAPVDVDGVLQNPPVVPVRDADPLPSSAKYVVVGAGIHGLSSAYHLAMALERSGKGRGSDVVLIDKAGPGAGATGLACGCVRNLYMTGPLHAILRASVEVWESDPVNFGFQQVGYVSIGEKNQYDDYVALNESQVASGYPSDLYAGADAHRFLKSLWPDFKTDNCDVVLHEHRSGYAGTHMVMWGLDQKCRQWGVQRVYGVAVTGYDMAGGAVTAVETTAGRIQCDQVVVGAGAWTPQHWEWLGGPSHLDVHYPDGHVEHDKSLWTYWRLLEGEVYLPPGVDYRTADGKDAPVLHVELMNTPVYGDDGEMIQDHVYTYTRYAAERVGAPGLQGGTIPIPIGDAAAVEPYGHLNDAYQADDWFPEYYCKTLGMLFERFENLEPYYKQRRNGGIGAFTADNVPIFDFVADNAWVIADSNHGFKMIGVGKLTADLLVGGDMPEELKPFGFDRYTTGATFGDRNSNCPWV